MLLPRVESHSRQKILRLFREAVENIVAIVNPEDDYKLVETLIKNQNVIRSYCSFYFFNIFDAITETIKKFNISPASIQIPFQILI
jgi:hypothetical protein